MIHFSIVKNLSNLCTTQQRVTNTERESREMPRWHRGLLANVVNLQLRLLCGRIICKIWLVQGTLPYIFPQFIHTQMIIMPVLGVIHLLNLNTQNPQQPRNIAFCIVIQSQTIICFKAVARNIKTEAQMLAIFQRIQSQSPTIQEKLNS